MKSRSAARMRIAVALLLGFAVGMGLWFVLTADHVGRDTAAFGKAYNQGYSDGYTAALPVYEKKASAKSGYMPLFLQKTLNGLTSLIRMKPSARMDAA